MGLISALTQSAGSVMADQWREYFYCEALPTNVLAVKGKKRQQRLIGGNKGNDNIISNGSIIAVANGQCMIIVDQGKVVDLCAEPGEYIYDTSSEPSILYGGLGKGILETFKNIGHRFTFGGEIPKDQRVYYMNTKELIGNKYGTQGAIPFRVVDKNIGLDIDIAIRCFGEYSYRISNPLLFYTNVCGNVQADYDRSKIDSQLKAELLTALQPAFGKLSDQGIRYSALPAHTMELADALNEVLSSKWRNLRGIEIVSLAVSSVKASAEDEQMIKEIQKNATLRDPSMAAAHLVGAQAAAMQAAASNTAGAMTGFMGMGMASNMGGMDTTALFQMNQQRQQAAAAPAQAAPAADSWTCSCGHVNTGKFCMECGSKKPVQVPEGGWTCSCGTVNKGKFCMECGSKKPADAPLYRCDKCGWEPKDPANPPKFCPECGDLFDESDIQQ